MDASKGLAVNIVFPLKNGLSLVIMGVYDAEEKKNWQLKKHKKLISTIISLFTGKQQHKKALI